MVDDVGDVGGKTFGQYLADRLLEARDRAIMPIVDEETGSEIPFPEVLVYADEHHGDLIASDVWSEWEENGILLDLSERMALEGVLLSIGAFDAIGMGPDDLAFVTLADIGASLYARGYLIGLLDGPDGPPTYEKMNEFIEGLIADVNEQIREQSEMIDLIVLEEDTE